MVAAALNALTRLAARELPPPERGGVRVSAVCPGDVLTRMCDDGARAQALTPSAAASDVAWLALAGLGLAGDADGGRGQAGFESGRFWRARRVIEF